MISMASSTQCTISTTWAAELRKGLVVSGFSPSLAAASFARGCSWSKLLFSRASAPTMYDSRLWCVHLAVEKGTHSSFVTWR